jgi:adenylate cyclase
MIEKERKFILKYLPSGLKKQKIKQGYISNNSKTQVRVRIIDDSSAFITVKFKIDNETRQEFEYKIPIDEGFEIYHSCSLKLEKIRYKTKYENNQIDIDVYQNGKSVVEIEYEDVLTKLPDYCGEEVTGVKEWSNSSIAKSIMENY